MTLLESLKKYTVVVADTGDIEAIARLKPQDATTNPSLLYRPPSSRNTSTWSMRPSSTPRARGGSETEQAEAFMDGLFVGFGREILKHVPGRVSTEVDAGLSFDTEGTLAKARKLIGMYEKAGVDREPRPDQDRQHLGRHPRRRAARARRHPLQPDAAVQLRPGGRLRRGGRDADLAVRRPDLRLVQEGQRRSPTSRPTRTRASSR